MLPILTMPLGKWHLSQSLPFPLERSSYRNRWSSLFAGIRQISFSLRCLIWIKARVLPSLYLLLLPLRLPPDSCYFCRSCSCYLPRVCSLFLPIVSSSALASRSQIRSCFPILIFSVFSFLSRFQVFCTMSVIEISSESEEEVTSGFRYSKSSCVPERCVYSLMHKGRQILHSLK